MTKQAGTHDHEIRPKVQALVSNNYPGYSAEFVGNASENVRRRSFGFRIVDSKGKPRTDTIWIGPSSYSRPNKQWLLEQVSRANSTLPVGYEGVWTALSLRTPCMDLDFWFGQRNEHASDKTGVGS
jgi:hypothetical protein